MRDSLTTKYGFFRLRENDGKFTYNKVTDKGEFVAPLWSGWKNEKDSLAWLEKNKKFIYA